MDLPLARAYDGIRGYEPILTYWERPRDFVNTYAYDPSGRLV
jgi:hypothetical protein